ncbi:MAG: serine hydrolase domain-containing protein [Caulobacteraceae bacterium]
MRPSPVLRGLALALATCVALAGPGRPRAQDAEASDTASSAAPAAPAPPRPRPAATPPAAAPAPTPPAPAESAPPIQPQAEPPAPAPQPAPPPPAKARLEPGTTIPPAELEALVDGAVQQAMAERHVAGATVAVVQNGQVVLKKGYGLSGVSPARPVDPDKTLFRVGSISKLFTWIMVMKDVERGRMKLDSPVNLYLPERLQVRDDGIQRQVMVRDLMTHATGFEVKTLGRLFEVKANRVRALDTYLWQERPRRVWPPGAMPEYSNYGAGLAGAAVAQVEGKPFMDLAEAAIIRPLGLTHTTFREPYPSDAGLPPPMPAELAADAAQGLVWASGGYRAQPYEYVSQLAPAGSASSTAGDMARFMQLILAGGTLDGTTVYGPATAQAFRTVTLRSGPGIAGWAGGFWERPLPGGFDSFGHEGQTLNFRSNLVTVPALNLGVFISVNSDSGAALVESLPGQIVSRFYAVPSPPAEGSPDLYAQRKAYAGDYLDEDRRYGGLEQFVALLSDRIQIDVSPDGRLIVMDGGAGGHAFVPTGQPGQFRQVGAPERVGGFQMKNDVAERWLDPSGAHTYVRIDGWWRRRVLLAGVLLTLLASGSTLIGLFTRDRREFRQTDVQGRASAIQNSTAILWFVAIGGFGWWAVRALRDPTVAFAEWPGPWVAIASSSAMVASLCSLAQTLMLPVVWRGGRRVESWTSWRKLRFSLTALIFLAFGVILLLWGALQPWSI